MYRILEDSMALTARKKPDPEANRRKTREWRARMRAKGLRPVQVWVYDARDPAFVAECRRQALAIANSPTESDDQAFIDAISLKFDQIP
jgi:hypothetical protein